MGEQVEGSTGGKTWLAAIVCGPAAGALIFLTLQVVGALLTMSSGGAFNGSGPIGMLLGGAMFGAIIGWPVMLFFGLPAHIFLYRRKSRKVGGYLLAGVLTGVAAVLVIMLLLAFGGAFGADSALAFGVVAFGFFCLFGSVLASWLFWLIRRPDKDVLRPDAVAAAFE